VENKNCGLKNTLSPVGLGGTAGTYSDGKETLEGDFEAGTGVAVSNTRRFEGSNKELSALSSFLCFALNLLFSRPGISIPYWFVCPISNYNNLRNKLACKVHLFQKLTFFFTV
jgi:hypothetical protein